MGYLKKNVNLTLLIIIIGVVVAMVGTTVFFQRVLQKQSGDLQNTAGDLGSCQAALSNYQEKYSEASQRVNDTAQDIRKYDELYEQKVRELKDSQQVLFDTQKDLEFERLQKEKFQESYEAQLKQAQQLQLEVDSLLSQIQDLREDIEELEDEVDACT